MTRVRAPCSWRTLASIRPASSQQGVARRRSRRPASRDQAAQDGEPGGEVGRLDRRPSGPTRSGRAGASARVESSLGMRSAESTSWLPPSYRALKVWKNSSSVRCLPSRNWTSSIEQHVEVAVALLEGLAALAPCSAATNSLVKRLGGRVADAERRARWRAGSWRSRPAGGSCRARAGRAGRAGCRPPRAPRRRPARRRGRGGCPRRSRSARRCSWG